MTHNVHVWGDSHWRVFFDQVNHGPPGYTTELMGIKTIDMCANELSGATMWGLLNPNSKNGARRRILGDLDALGPVKNVGFTFGEVDARYPQHHDRYFNEKGRICFGRLMELTARFRRFIEEDLLEAGRVTDNIFFCHGYTYPLAEDTLLQPGQRLGDQGYRRAMAVNAYLTPMLEYALGAYQPEVKVIRTNPSFLDVSTDGVHLIPERVCTRVFQEMFDRLKTPTQEGLSW